MDMEAQIVAALKTELQRQSAEAGEALRVNDLAPARVQVEGAVDLEALAMAVAGAVAGGP